jgi:hypothetical protein
MGIFATLAYHVRYQYRPYQPVPLVEEAGRVGLDYSFNSFQTLCDRSKEAKLSLGIILLL